MPLDNSEQALTSKRLIAPAPLDRKRIAITLAERDAILTSERYHMMKVSVQEDGKEYQLKDVGDLSIWSEVILSGIGEAPLDGKAYNRKGAGLGEGGEAGS